VEATIIASLLQNTSVSSATGRIMATIIVEHRFEDRPFDVERYERAQVENADSTDKILFSRSRAADTSSARNRWRARVRGWSQSIGGVPLWSAAPPIPRRRGAARKAHRRRASILSTSRLRVSRRRCPVEVER
jgi:hypothetical protein